MENGIWGVAGALAGAVIVGIIWWWIAGKGARRMRRAGKEGERRVSQELHMLSKRHFIIFDDLLIRKSEGESVQIDHLIVSTRGIFVIETKSHRGFISGSEHSQYWEQRGRKESKSFYNPLLQNRSHMKLLAASLRKEDSGIELSDTGVGIVVFTNSDGLSVRADDIVEQGIFGERRIRRTLDPGKRHKERWWESRKKRVVLDERKMVMQLQQLLPEIKWRRKIWSREEMKYVASIIEEMDIRSRSEHRRHAAYAKERSREAERKISRGECPRCGGRLIVREGENGAYLGCENYPSCRFSCRL